MTRGRLRKKMCRPPGPRGFTLLELMVVIALLGTIFFITVPRIVTTVSVSDLDESARAIAAKLSSARDRALADGKDYYLLIDMTNRQLRVVDAEKKDEEKDREGAGDAFRLPGQVSVADVQYDDGNSQSTGTAEILITKEGYARYAAVHLSDDDLSMTVFLEPFLSGVRITHDHQAMELSDS